MFLFAPGKGGLTLPKIRENIFISLSSASKKRKKKEKNTQNKAGRAMPWNSESISILPHIGGEEIGKSKEEPSSLKVWMNETVGGEVMGTKSG